MVSISAPKVGNSSTVNDIWTLVLVGKTGNGKSATGNSILGKGTFNLSGGKKSVAENSVARTNDLVKGQTIQVIDTPGVLDTSSDYKTIANEILNSINLATNGIHALLIVLSVKNRFPDAEETAVYYLLDLFGMNILKYAILVLTGGDVIDEEDEENDLVTNGEGDRLTDYLRGNCPDSLKEICTLCCNRMVLFDNRTKDKTKNSTQVHKLLSLIDQVLAENGGKPYTKLNCGEEVTMRLQGKEFDIEGDSSLLKAKFKKAYEAQLNQIAAENDCKLREIKRTQDENIARELAKLTEKKEALAKEIKKNNEMLETGKARERAVEDMKKIVLIGKDQGQEDGFRRESSLPIQKPHEELTAAKQLTTQKMKSKLSETRSKPQGETSAQQEQTGANQSTPEQIRSYIEITKDSTPEMPNVESKTVELVREASNAQSETSNNAVGREAFVPCLSMTSDTKTVVSTNDHVEVPPIKIIDSPDNVSKVLLIKKVLAENGGVTQELAEKDVILTHQGYAVGFPGESSQTRGKIEKMYENPKESELRETGELPYERIPKIVKELKEIGMAKEKDRREYKKDMKNRTAREKQLRRELKREMRGISKMSKHPKCCSCSSL